MMPALQPPDSLHLQAAEGWVGLGDYASANNELEQISRTNRAHPDVLQLRWRIYADAGKWDACLDIATALTTMTPERPFGWIHRAHTLDRLGRTQEAKELLLASGPKFEKNATIPFDLARYCSKLGQVVEAQQWLGKALLAADGIEELRRVRDLALGDPDLEPLRKMP
jgi:uncharacterized protein HemY